MSQHKIVEQHGMSSPVLMALVVLSEKSLPLSIRVDVCYESVK
ncbi:hypothetical protein FACS189418_8250 [Clostridia bacterium]|nr:hypothetical protein FACS189418_8250 [Clostridia bacterium]